MRACNITKSLLKKNFHSRKADGDGSITSNCTLSTLIVIPYIAYQTNSPNKIKGWCLEAIN